MFLLLTANSLSSLSSLDMVKMVPNYCYLVLCVNFLIFTINGELPKPVNVTLKSGIFLGETDRVEFGGSFKSVQWYLGIPYASPPIGERRFARPEPPGVLPIPYNATYHRPHCLQTVPLYYNHLYEIVRSEDCLYLNVYVPGERLLTPTTFPVMVYIHGGSFAIGGADIYSGEKLSAFNDVITVTINYRLNVFGFLSNGTKSSGNFGLWDIKLSLEWIHENIGRFGGDPNRVTLFGNSAGGSAVLYMAMYAGNRGLFQRVIAQSGTNVADWAFQKESIKFYEKTMKDNGCEYSKYEEIIACLRGKPAENLQVDSLEYLPAMDFDFIPDEPVKLLMGTSAKGKEAVSFFAEIDLINGVTSKDGALAYGYWKSVLGIESLDEGITRVQFEKLIPFLTKDVGDSCKTLKEAIMYVYTDWFKPDDPNRIRSKLVDFQSDKEFFVPALSLSIKHNRILKNSHKSKNYFYLFDHKPGFVPEPQWLKGSIHTMEVAYIFGLHDSMERKLVEDLGGSDPFIVKEDDLKLSDALMVLWTNFAKSGDPNRPVPFPDESIPTWPEFDSQNQTYLTLEMNMTEASVKRHLAAPRIAFWTKLYPVLFESCQNERSHQTSTANKTDTRFSYVFILVLFVLALIGEDKLYIFRY